MSPSMYFFWCSRELLLNFKLPGSSLRPFRASWSIRLRSLQLRALPMSTTCNLFLWTLPLPRLWPPPTMVRSSHLWSFFVPEFQPLIVLRSWSPCLLPQSELQLQSLFIPRPWSPHLRPLSTQYFTAARLAMPALDHTALRFAITPFFVTLLLHRW